MNRFFGGMLVVALACVGVLGAACDFGGSMPAAPGTTGPFPPSTPPSETFSGSIVELGASDFYDFTTTAAGDIDVTLSATAPSATVRVFIGLGAPNGRGCALGSEVNFVQAGPALAVPALNHAPGTYCVEVDDWFHLAPFTYTVQIWHH